MKHKHADLIHAWADGAVIEGLMCGTWVERETPAWDERIEYRIKPEEKKPVVRWLWALMTSEGKYNPSCLFYTDDEASMFHAPIKLEWSRTEFPK